MPSGSANALIDTVTVSGLSRRWASTRLRVCSSVSRSVSMSVSETGPTAPVSCTLVVRPSTKTPLASSSDTSICLSKSRCITPRARSRRGDGSSKTGRVPSIRKAFENESDWGVPGTGRSSTVFLLEALTVPPFNRRDDTPTYPRSGVESPYCTGYQKLIVFVPEPVT